MKFRTPSQEKMKLVFVYPIVVEDSLRKYQNDLRDFATVNFVAALKTSNALDITAKAIAPAPNQDQITPAQALNRQLSDLNIYHQMPIPSYHQSRTSDQEQQQRIDKFYNFLKNQIEHDPRYASLRPMFSSVSIDSNYFVEIPLIVGTRDYVVPAVSLYWVLLIAFIKGLDLSNPTSISRIKSMTEVITDQNYYDMLFSDKTLTAELGKAVGASKLEKIARMSSTIDKRDQLTKLSGSRFSGRRLSKTSIFGKQIKNQYEQAAFRLAAVTNEKEWERNNEGIISTPQTIISKVMDATAGERKSKFVQAVSTFDNSIGNFIIPQIYSYYTILESQVNIGNLLNLFTDRLQDDLLNTNTGFDIVGESYANINRYDVNLTQQDSADRVINTIEKSCDNLRELNIYNLFRGTYGRDLNQQLSSTFSETDILDFLKSGESLSAKIIPLINNLEDQLHAISSESDKQIRGPGGVRSKITGIVAKLFEDSRSPEGCLYQKYAENPNIRNNESSHDRLFQILGHPPNNKMKNILNEIVGNAKNLISNLIYFFYLYSLLNMLCDYIKTVKLQIKTTDHDVVDFPNYTLVIPLSHLKGIWYAKAARSFSDMLLSGDRLDALNPNSIILIINNMMDTLKIPNLIVVDESKKEIYYRFMNQSFPLKISFNALDTFVKHQKNVLPGY